MNPNLEHELVYLRPSVTREELGQKGPNWGTRGMKGILGNLEEKGTQKEKKTGTPSETECRLGNPFPQISGNSGLTLKSG